MRKLVFIPFLAAIGFSATMSVQAADVNAGKQLSSSCQSCHGQKGISSNPLYPNLAGQKAPYLAKQMRDFKSGKRQDPVMSAMVKSLDDKAIDDLAAFYSSLGK